MAKVAYLDDNTLLGRCYRLRSYQELGLQIWEEKDSLSYYKEEAGHIYGYHIRSNVPLTKLYGFPCYVVKFVFSGIETIHQEQQEDILNQLCAHLRDQMRSQRGYYNLRVPTHVVDLLKAVNHQLDHLIFCGGTVEGIYVGGKELPLPRDGVTVFFADRTFAANNRDHMIKLTYDSFKRYQGQYHISPVTALKAGEIYANWIQEYFDNFADNTIMVARHDQETVGYALSQENNIAVDLVLGSVDESVRHLGIYKAITASLIRYALQHEKIFVSSTQFDNFIAQGVWSSIGIRPFYSIYNFHYDNR